MFKLKFKSGFTLIEILIVIAIIGILASVAIIGLGGSRVKARDSKKISEVSQIRNALELYFTTCGFYPGTGGCVAGDVADYGVMKGAIQTAVSSVTNMPPAAVAPAPEPFIYGSDSGNLGYVLGVQLEENNSILTSGWEGTAFGVTCSKANKQYCIHS